MKNEYLEFFPAIKNVFLLKPENMLECENRSPSLHENIKNGMECTAPGRDRLRALQPTDLLARSTLGGAGRLHVAAEQGCLVAV